MRKYQTRRIKAHEAKTPYVRAYQQRNVADGLCRACPNPLSPDSTQYCERHLQEQRAYQREYKRTRRAE